LGGWYYSSGFKEFLNTNISGNPVYQKGNYGIYFSAEKFLFSEIKNPGEGLAGFLSIGMSNKNINRVDSYFGAGINYTGLVPGRDKDQFGIALALAHNSSKYIIQMQSENIDISSYESIIEMTYLLILSDWLKLQPDIQYVINPVYSLNYAYSFVSGIRIELIL
jgi:porin